MIERELKPQDVNETCFQVPGLRQIHGCLDIASQLRSGRQFDVQAVTYELPTSYMGLATVTVRGKDAILVEKINGLATDFAEDLRHEPEQKLADLTDCAKDLLLLALMYRGGNETIEQEISRFAKDISEDQKLTIDQRYHDIVKRTTSLLTFAKAHFAE